LDGIPQKCLSGNFSIASINILNIRIENFEKQLEKKNLTFAQ
jgi:hypothetical protein